MRSDLFQHELARTSAVFGRRNDVRVVFRAAEGGEMIPMFPTT